MLPLDIIQDFLFVSFGYWLGWRRNRKFRALVLRTAAEMREILAMRKGQPPC